MSRGSVTPITVGLLLVGLVVGLAGGYLYTNNMYKPRITEPEGSITDLTNQYNDLTDQNISLGINISSLRADVAATIEIESFRSVYQKTHLENRQIYELG